LEIEVDRTENGDRTNFETPSGTWRKDEMGSYLEKLTNYQQPVYSDTSTTRNPD